MSLVIGIGLLAVAVVIGLAAMSRRRRRLRVHVLAFFGPHSTRASQDVAKLLSRWCAITVAKDAQVSVEGRVEETNGETILRIRFRDQSAQVISNVTATLPRGSDEAAMAPLQELLENAVRSIEHERAVIAKRRA